MRRVKVVLPAAAADFGPSLSGPSGGVGLALGLYTTVEFIERTDDQLVVETGGEDAGAYGIGLRHPAVIGMSRVFQYAEKAVLGVTVRVETAAPRALDMGAEAALFAAGIIGGNNLLANPLRRDEVLAMAMRASEQPTHAVTAMLGGLNVLAQPPGGSTHYRALALSTRWSVVVIAPGPAQARTDAPTATAELRPPRALALSEVQRALSAVPLLLEGVRTGDFALLAGLLAAPTWPFAHAEAAEIAQGVIAAFAPTARCSLTSVGRRGALLVFAEREVPRIAEALRDAYDDAGLSARVWVLPVDTQGVVVSVAQTAQ